MRTGKAVAMVPLAVAHEVAMQAVAVVGCFSSQDFLSLDLQCHWDAEEEQQGEYL